jgi:hypothetical protein
MTALRIGGPDQVHSETNPVLFYFSCPPFSYSSSLIVIPINDHPQINFLEIDVPKEGLANVGKLRPIFSDF